VNWKAALERLDRNEDLLMELAALFCVECPKLVSALQEAEAKKDAEAVRVAAHSLKGVLGTFSADTAAHTAARLESLAEAGKLTELAKVSAALMAEVEEVFVTLEAITSAAGNTAEAPGAAKRRLS
jgi:two-component system, sensor histidine kinase and response regulator